MLTESKAPVACPDCKDEVAALPVELKRRLHVTRRLRRRYMVQYECPECALRWWTHEWKRTI